MSAHACRPVLEGAAHAGIEWRGHAELERALAAAPDDVRDAVRWLPPGRATELSPAARTQQ